MRTRIIVVLSGLALIATLGVPPTAFAGLRGTVAQGDGTPVAPAYVRAINTATGADARTETAADGSYELADLPRGNYVVVVTVECCLYLPYSNDTVAIVDGADTELNVELALFNVNVEGDDPATVNAELLSGQEIPDLPAPRMADGSPDLTGTWLVSDDPYADPPAALDWAQQAFEQ